MDRNTPDYNYLDRLNPQQRDAVVYCDGPSLVIAGAGSGKTRVLTYKIVHLLAHGYEPYRIMALTFTNKAAREMKERIAAVVGNDIASRLWMGTFHSVFLRLLRRHSELIGYQPGFTIYDAADAKSLIKIIIRDLGLDEKQYKPATVAAAISNAKNALVSPAQYIRDHNNYEADKRSGRPLIGEIYRIYCQRCRLSNAMDFDDILFNMNVLLRDNPDIARHYQDFFKYILVDEYQDTNFAQHLVISQLGGDRQRVCVVGDDAQSIYSFRGANIDNILGLEKRYPGLKIFKLERNYRSTRNIIDAAGSLISKNKRQMKKNVYSEKEEGSLIDVIRTYSDIEEATIVVSQIMQMKHLEGDSYEDYAILYRTNAQSRVFEEKLRAKNIPYRIHGGIAFYQRKEVKDAICYFRTALNPDDDEALRRIINYPARGIGKTTLDKITAAAIRDGKSLWHVICHPHEAQLQINSGTEKKLAAFASLISEFNTFCADADALQAAELIYRRTGILANLEHDNTPESISAKENLTELLAAVKTYVDNSIQAGVELPGMSGFLSEVSLATDMDEDEADEQAKVTLMTVHASKGLEYKHVIIVGLEEDLFPSALAQSSPAEIEEERRLLYVAITRAMQTCTLTYASSRYRNGQTQITNPSRFIVDIDPKYLRLGASANMPRSSSPWADSSSRPRRPAFSSQQRPASKTYGASAAPKSPLKKVSKLAPDNGHKIEGTHTADELAPGTRIRHSLFGTGTVTSIAGPAAQTIITVDFGPEEGIRKLMLRFAKFDILK